MQTKAKNKELLDYLLNEDYDKNALAPLIDAAADRMTAAKPVPLYLHSWSTKPACHGIYLYRILMQEERLDGPAVMRIYKAMKQGFTPKNPLYHVLLGPIYLRRAMEFLEGRNTGLISIDDDGDLLGFDAHIYVRTYTEAFFTTDGILIGLGHGEFFVEDPKGERKLLEESIVPLDTLPAPYGDKYEDWLRHFVPAPNEIWRL